MKPHAGIAGIDYGLGQTNIDATNGIRYGVIAQHSVMAEALGDMELDYGKPHCPKCGGEVVDSRDDTIPEDVEWNEGKDYACIPCESVYWSDEVFPEECIGLYFDRDGYKITDCLDCNLMVIASSFYTYARFCSPCVPGAGDLDATVPDGVKTYALGHNWFDGHIAPYPVYRVSDSKQIISSRVSVTCPKCNGKGRDTIARIANVRKCTESEVYASIDTGREQSIRGLDRTSWTFDCWRCDGKGVYTEVRETEGETDART